MSIFEIETEDAIFINRLNRFTVEVELRGERILAHITNTGRLSEFLIKGRRCLVRRIDGGRLRYRLVSMADRGGKYAIIDTITQNHVFERMVDMGMIPWLSGCIILSRNPLVDGSRLDYILECGGEYVYIETKSAVLRGQDNVAMYPDCPTIRGRRHIKELMNLVSMGRRCMLIFIAALPDVDCFRPNRDADEEVAELIYKAIDTGVEVYALSIYMDQYGKIYLSNSNLPLCI